MSEEELNGRLAQTDPLWSRHAWLRAETLQTLAAVNEQCLQLLCEQSAHDSSGGGALTRELTGLWGILDAPARARAARCPCLLMDVGFMRASRWRWSRDSQVRDSERIAEPGAFFSVPATVGVMRLVLTYAWHLACSQSAAARLLLGMSGRSVELIAGCTLSEVTQLAERSPQWLVPRWPDYLPFWRELLTAAVGADRVALERTGLRAVQLLAGEIRIRAENE